MPGINLQKFWDYSLDVARVSRSLAGLVRQNQQAAFTCGLIHAIGELAMHLALPEAMASLDADVAPSTCAAPRLSGVYWATATPAWVRAMPNAGNFRKP